MLHNNTISEIKTSTNPGVEYEIALFYKLLPAGSGEAAQVMSAIKSRVDCQKIVGIIGLTDESIILREVQKLGVALVDVSFETQNDDVGPADIVLYVEDGAGKPKRIGLSVKFANTCTLNVTGRKFITDLQIARIKNRYISHYVPKYKADMAARFGNASNWHRKTSTVTDEVIDEIRDAVIENWKNVPDKVALLSNLFHADSPIEFWVVSYRNTGYSLRTVPQTVDMKRAQDVEVRKYQTSYVAFYLDNVRVAHMQVKFNNGFIESNFNHKGLRKRKAPDFIVDGLEFIYGQPFGSWNFSVEE